MFRPHPTGTPLRITLRWSSGRAPAGVQRSAPGCASSRCGRRQLHPGCRGTRRHRRGRPPALFPVRGRPAAAAARGGWRRTRRGGCMLRRHRRTFRAAGSRSPTAHVHTRVPGNQGAAREWQWTSQTSKTSPTPKIAPNQPFASCLTNLAPPTDHPWSHSPLLSSEQVIGFD